MLRNPELWLRKSSPTILVSALIGDVRIAFTDFLTTTTYMSVVSIESKTLKITDDVFENCNWGSDGELEFGGFL